MKYVYYQIYPRIMFKEVEGNVSAVVHTLTGGPTGRGSRGNGFTASLSMLIGRSYRVRPDHSYT